MGLSPLTYKMEKEMKEWPNAYTMYDLPEEEPKYYELMKDIPRDELPAWRTDYDDWLELRSAGWNYILLYFFLYGLIDWLLNVNKG